MSTETALFWPRWAMRVTLVPATLLSLPILGVNLISWNFAPRWGPAAVNYTYENEATNALKEAASQHATMVATSITVTAAIAVLIATVLFMIWPRTFGFLIVASITPAALALIWITTKADLATIA